MASATPRAVADLIHRLASRHASADTPDEELLRRFAATGDANAFELLLWRHERMVMGVCRRVLRDVHDAEDAFQATFLVLARKARSIAARRVVTTWLYAVAYRVALNALKERTRRLARVGPLPDGTEPVTPNGPGQPDVGGLLDEAVNSLPARYRGPVLLCLLEGRSHAEAARVLGCATGTVASRLARAKARLRAWLARHGVRAPAGALAAGLGAAGAPSASARAIVSVTLQTAKAVLAGAPCPAAVSPRVLVLAQGALDTMFRTRLLQILAVVLAAVVVWGAGRCLTAQDAPAAEPPPAPKAPDPGKAEPPEKKAERTDAFGEPLPAGAVARLGSLRLYHDSQVQRVVLSPDGKWVVGWDQTGNRLWDAQTGKESPLPRDLLDVWDAKTKTMRRTTILATADRLVAVKKEKDRIILWDVAAAKEIAKLPLEDGASEEFELSPDGKTLVCSPSGLKRDAPHKLVFIDVAKATVRHSVDLAEGKSVCPSDLTGLHSRGLTFSADGSTLAVQYWANWVNGNWVNANWVEVWDAKTNTVRYSCEGCEHVGLSPDGRMLAGASRGEKKVHLWDVRARKELEPLPLDPTLDPSRSKFATGVTHAVAFSPDGKFLAVTCEAELVPYDLATRKVVQRLKGTGPSLPDLVFSQDGKRLAAGDDRAVALWDLKTGEPCHDFGHGYGIPAVAFSPDGRTIVTGATYSDPVVRSWDALTGKIKRHMRGNTDGIESIAYAPGGLLVASSSDDGTVRLWDAATGKEIGCLDARDGAVKAIAFSPDGKTLASGGERKVVHLWDVATRKEVRTFDNPGGRTVCLAFSPDGQTLATRGAAEDRVRIWDVAAGTQRREFGGLSAGNDRLVNLGRPRLSFSPDNRTLAVNCDDGTVHLLDVTTGKELRVLGESQRAAAGGGPAGGGGPPGCPCLGVTFAPDGRSLAASYDANYNPEYNLWVRVWEVASGRERTRFKGHHGFVMVSAYSPDGTLLVTGGTDRTALVWDVFGLRTSDQKKADFTRADVDRLWADLADTDAGKAFGAMKVLRANGAQAVSLLKERLRPAAATDPKKIARLIADLDQEDFTARESATKQLSELGELAEPALRAALNDKPSADKRRRVEDLLKRLDASNSPELLRGVRAVEVLESLDTPEARQVLQALAQGAAEARLTREAKAARERRKR